MNRQNRNFYKLEIGSNYIRRDGATVRIPKVQINNSGVGSHSRRYYCDRGQTYNQHGQVLGQRADLPVNPDDHEFDLVVLVGIAGEDPHGTQVKREAICAKCGSSEIKARSWSIWDTDSGQWVLHEVKRGMFCDICQEDTTADWVYQ